MDFSWFRVAQTGFRLPVAKDSSDFLSFLLTHLPSAGITGAGFVARHSSSSSRTQFQTAVPTPLSSLTLASSGFCMHVNVPPPTNKCIKLKCTFENNNSCFLEMHRTDTPSPQEAAVGGQKASGQPGLILKFCFKYTKQC